MRITERDRQIVIAVGRFRQLASGHVRTLFFSDLRSDTQCDRRLAYLTRHGFLRHVYRRPVGGKGGGSGQYVYQLGPRGWHVIFGEKQRYNPLRSIDFHALAIADAYTAVRKLTHEGRYELLGYDVEPESWLKVAGVELTPDLYIDLGDTETGKALSWWLEVDMGTERQKQIHDKLTRYYKAWDAAEEGSPAYYTKVVFLTPDAERLRDLRRMVERWSSNEEARGLFTVELQADFPHCLLV